MKNIKFIIIAFICAVFITGCVSEHVEYQSVSLDIYDCRGTRPQNFKNSTILIPAPNFKQEEFNVGSGSLQELIRTNTK